MSKIDDGGSAFPQAQRLFDNDTQSWIVMSKGGMSLRDYFAGQTLSGWLASMTDVDCPQIDRVAVFSYKVADAMLEARKGKKP